MPARAAFGLPLAGGPLDAVKLAAALFMLGDHVNTVLLEGAEPLLWRFGRIAFPLFCYVTACHVVRGADPRRYLSVLLLLAIPTQPIFAFAFGKPTGNVLFTLAAGAALAAALPRLAPWGRHAVFGAGAAVSLAFPAWASTGADFGVAGMLLPAAIAATLRGERAMLPWLALLIFALNVPAARAPGETVWSGPALDALFAGFGSLVVVALAGLLIAVGRFLPRFALHLFYPGHLAALAGMRTLV